MAKKYTFFLGANSGSGFSSLYDQLRPREDMRDLIVLKGGPGVGKSTFMKHIGARAEQLYAQYPQSEEGFDAWVLRAERFWKECGSMAENEVV